MRKIIPLGGIWTARAGTVQAEVRLPGTLDENGVGFPENPLRQWKVEEVRRIGFWREGDPIVTRLTRKNTFEGPAEFERTLEWEIPAGKRIFAEAERARQLRLRVNGREAPASRPGTVSTPAVFEITGMTSGRDTLLFLCDNSYPGWPRDAIVYSSAASDETQTNWNGLLGYLRLRAEEPVFVDRVRVYPRGGKLEIRVEMDADRPWEGTLRAESPALKEPVLIPARIPAGRTELRAEGVTAENAALWDLEEGNLHSLTVSGPGLDEREAVFGIRDFRAEDGRLLLNGRPVFLHSEANCAASASCTAVTPGAGRKSLACRLPSVMVPVLSSKSVSTSPAASTARPDIASTLKRIRRSMPAMPIADRSAPMVVGISVTNSATRITTDTAPPA